MSDYQSKLDDLKFHNWIKTGLALMYTKEGLCDAIREEIEKFKENALNDILSTLNLPEGSICNVCTASDIEFSRVKCPKNGLCERFRDRIMQVHVYNNPSWKNTDTKLWYTDSYQIAKCFMPKGGYEDKKSFPETDFNGVINVIINCKGLQNITKEDLSRKDNIFHKARDISRKFRHSATLEVNKDEFLEYTETFTKILRDPKCLASKPSTCAALQKMEQLKEESWTIISALKDVCFLVDEETNYLDENDTFESGTGIKRTLLGQLKTSVIEEEFINRLVKEYQAHCSTLPISALIEEEDAQLVDFFANPTLRQVEYHNIKSKCANVRSYKDIFSKNGKPCRNIYVTGEAGIGKTAFCQRMVLAWCYAKSGREENNIFSPEDIDAMKRFRFLFYVSLRETKLCRVREMIEQQLQEFRNAHVIPKILEEESCLIILDGLDEWTHQTAEETCPINQKVPHRPSSKNCTYLTTTRPWKLEGNRLKTNEIDQQIELIGLDKLSRNEIIFSVIEHLNKRFEDSRKPKEFQSEITSKRLNTVCEVPIVLMQLICLWFDERTLGPSRCSIYGETIDMLFRRASDRNRQLKNEEQISNFDNELPECLNTLQVFSQHASLLYKLGHLAFEGLFGKPDGESELIFDSGRGKIFDISGTEMNYLLSVGILSKNKVVGPLTKRKLKLSFLHKSYQEFLGALYIAMQKDEASVESKIFSTCKTLTMFLRYENMFIFLSGMRPDLVSKFSDSIRAIFLSDKKICTYRRFSDYKFGFVIMLPPFSILTDPKFVDIRDAEVSLQTYQTFALQCREESQRAGGKTTAVYIEDMFLPEKCSEDLHSLFVSNRDILKSITTEKYHDDLLRVKNVEKISINLQSDEDSMGGDLQKYEEFMTFSKSTLKCLSISNARGMFDLGKLQFPQLKSIDLYNIVLKHQEIMNLFAFISNKTDLIQILLFQLKCFEHGEECTGSTLNLLNHQVLDFLRLHRIYEFGEHETRINCKKLETFIFEDSRKATSKTSALIRDIRNAPCLIEVTLLGISSNDTFDSLLTVIPSIKHLKRLSFYNCDFGDNHVALDANFQREIESICLLNSSITLNAFCKLVDSIPVDTDNMVSVHMQSCKFSIEDKETTAKDGVEAARDYLTSKSSFHVYICEPFKFHFSVYS